MSRYKKLSKKLPLDYNVDSFSFSRQQMFLWNNIFFSLGFDVKDHYKDFGGDAAAYVAPVSLLKAKFFLSVD